jgi:DNA-binding Lrp family transcriptional regulator
MAGTKLDKLDMRILELLQNSSMLTPKLSEMAKEVGTTNATVFRRIEALKKNGIIVGHSTRIDQRLMGKVFQALIYLRLPRSVSSEEKEKLSNKLLELEHAEAIYVPLGKWSYILKTSHRDVEELNKFVQDELGKIPYDEMEIELILKVVKEGHVSVPKNIEPKQH